MSIIIIQDGQETDPNNPGAAITALIQLSAAILTRVRSLTGQMGNLATKNDLNPIVDIISDLLMKQSEQNDLTKKVLHRLNEAHHEITTKIEGQQKTIDKLIADMSDPEVKDPEIIATLNQLKATTDKLADIVPDDVVMSPEGNVSTQPAAEDPQVADPNAPLVPPNETDVRPGTEEPDATAENQPVRDDTSRSGQVSR